MNHIVNNTKGALKLLLLHLQHPNTVIEKQATSAAQEALTMLDAVDDATQRLESTYAAVRAVVQPSLAVAVLPLSEPQNKRSTRVLVLDGNTVIASADGHSPCAIAEVLRLKLTLAAKPTEPIAMPRITPQEARLDQEYNALHDGMKRLKRKLPDMSEMNAARARRSIDNIREQMHHIDAQRMRIQNLRAVS